MPDIQWDAPASLMRVTHFATAEASESVEARGTVAELVGAVLEMTPDQQRDLLIRAAGADWVQEFDGDAIRELAARPEFTGADGGAYDTVRLHADADRNEQVDVLVTGDSISDPQADRHIVLE